MDSGLDAENPGEKVFFSLEGGGDFVGEDLSAA
jgi:hypothetical protein